MNIKVAAVSLGCPKNMTDLEVMLAKIVESGMEIVNEDEADVIIVNTCAFIGDAKEESIDVISDVLNLKENGSLKAVVATGCLAELFGEKLFEEIPNLDVVVSLGKNSDIVNILKECFECEKTLHKCTNTELPLDGERLCLSASYTAYVKIAEGCDNHCAYCIIPKIRGKFRSRGFESILEEVKVLAARGVKELVLIAQDTTRWGSDLENKPDLADLVEKISEIDGICWIRIMYAYPDGISEKLLHLMRDNEKLVEYIDMPIQHCEDNVLKRMGRRDDKKAVSEKLEKMREIVPNIAIRTTLITGFSGETVADFRELKKFVKEQAFTHLGCFVYSREEGTPAYNLPEQVEESEKLRRQNAVLDVQDEVVKTYYKSLKNMIIEGIVEGYDDFLKLYFGRLRTQAPEIDGNVFFSSENALTAGGIINIKITGTIENQLFGIHYI